MARIAGVDIPREKRVIISLTYIHGIGPTSASRVLGAANVATGFAKTFPVSSSGSRTVIGEALGSRSQLYSLVAVVAVVAVVRAGGPDRITVSGGVLSAGAPATVHVCSAGVASTKPWTLARTRSVWSPSARSA